MFTSDNNIKINFVEEKANNGVIVRSVLMLNVEERDVNSCVVLYKELRRQLEENSGVITKNKTEILNCPVCPDCKAQMILRTKKATGDFFWGCSRFSQGCKKTMPFLTNQKENIKIPSLVR